MRRISLLFSLLLALLMVPAFRTTAAPSHTPVLVVTGDAETVFDYTTDPCEPDDIPDMPARAFRNAEGQTVLIATHFTAYRSLGSDLDTVARDCQHILKTSAANPDPALYTDKEWLAAPYTEDGTVVYALLHNEYQGHTHAGQCASGDYFTCWYNALTLAVSTDSGLSFDYAAAPPQHLVASAGRVYEDGAGPYGVFEPSNIIKGPDGLYYVLVKVDGYQSDSQWVCLLRTDNITDPTAWRAWDGADFRTTFSNPYTTIDAQPCAPLARAEIGIMHESLSFNTTLQRYVLVGTASDFINGREVWGVYYAFSTDLINWSYRQLLLETELVYTYAAGDPDPIAYPALLDPSSESRNYETTDADAYLYYTQFNYADGQPTLDRDLMRVPVTFYPAATALAPLGAVTSLTLTADDLNLNGELLDRDGDPISGATISLATYPTDLTYTLTESVPEGAALAVVGLRINTECGGCAGESDLVVGSISYRQGADEESRVPNGDFALGIGDWYLWGEGVTSIGDNGLNIRTDLLQKTGLNSPNFPVEAGDYTLTVEAIVRPTTLAAHYFTVIFLDAAGLEVGRHRIPMNPNLQIVGTAFTDAEGRFSLALDALPPIEVLLEATYAGDTTHQPSRATLEVDAD